jgi:hypothetical protein
MFANLPTPPVDSRARVRRAPVARPASPPSAGRPEVRDTLLRHILRQRLRTYFRVEMPQATDVRAWRSSRSRFAAKTKLGRHHLAALPLRISKATPTWLLDSMAPMMLDLGNSPLIHGSRPRGDPRKRFEKTTAVVKPFTAFTPLPERSSGRNERPCISPGPSKADGFEPSRDEEDLRCSM